MVSVVNVLDCTSVILSLIHVIMTACKLASGLNLEDVNIKSRLELRLS